MKKIFFLTTVVISLSFGAARAQKTIWKANVTTGEFGSLNVNFFLDNSSSYIFGTTGAEAHKRVVDGLKAAFAKSSFQKDGSIMELDSLLFSGNTFSGYLVIQKKKYFLQGIKIDDKITATLIGRVSGVTYGKLTANVVDKAEIPNNYVELWKEMKGLTEQYIYKKNILDTKSWKSFANDMDEFSKIAQDDAEFMYGFFYKSSNLPFSHYNLSGRKNDSSNYATAGPTVSQKRPSPSLENISEATYLLDVPAFNFRMEEIDSMMIRLVNSKAKNLIIDLRKNPGGDMEGAMRICQYITDKPLYGGVMLSQSYWEKNTAPPAIESYKNFKQMNVANYEWFKKEVKKNIDGLSLVSIPLDKTYKGKVYILTSNTTASTSEPFVYSLQKEQRATIIGGKTAGAMLSMEQFDFQNFTLAIPRLDYYTSDGKRLDQVGVEPDVKCDPKIALQTALDIISKK